MVMKDTSQKELKVAFLFNFVWFLLIMTTTVYSHLFLTETCDHFDSFIEDFNLREFKITHPTKSGKSMVFVILSFYGMLTLFTKLPFLSIPLVNSFIFGCCKKKVESNQLPVQNILESNIDEKTQNDLEPPLPFLQVQNVSNSTENEKEVLNIQQSIQ